MQMATAYWASSVLLTANRLGLFSTVGEAVLSADEIAAKLNLASYPLDGFLNACVSLGLLQREANGYTTSALARFYLVEGRPAYLGQALRYADDLYSVWGNLESTLRSGKPALPPTTILGQDPIRTRHFVLGMHNRALGIGRALASDLDLTGRTRLLDVGGGPATYSCLLAQRNPQLRSRSMDLPAVVEIAATIVRDFGLQDRVQPIVGDYHQETYPDGNDVVLCSGMFHRETPDSCRQILRKAYAALEPGGLVVVQDVLCDDTKTGPPFALLFGLNMSLTSEFGAVHSSAEVATWMAEAGFGEITRRALPPPWPENLVLGKKPA
jgi:hypothetical protein